MHPDGPRCWHGLGRRLACDMNPVDSKLTVAVVDDDASMLRALARLVQTAGYAVKPYASAAEFLDGGVSGAICCLVVDVQMPDIDEYRDGALAQRVISIPVLYITAHDSTWAREKAAEAHAQGFLVKPFEPKQLLGAISGTLRPSRDVAGAPA